MKAAAATRQPVEAELGEAVARRLERDMVDRRARASSRKVAVQRHRVGRGQRAGLALEAGRDDAERAEARGVVAEAPPDLAGEMRRPRSCRWCR